MEDNHESGWVYIMRNPSIPNMVKIGSTLNDPEERARQLSTATGVPTPFFVVHAVATRWPRETEEHFRNDHRWCRVSPNREFFEANFTDDLHMASDSDYDAYYSLAIQNAIKYVEMKMELEELTRRFQLLDVQHDRERIAFLRECQKHNYPERWAEDQARLQLLREQTAHPQEGAGDNREG
jgi:hypothetical protein